jgi:hypothetical protein
LITGGWIGGADDAVTIAEARHGLFACAEQSVPGLVKAADPVVANRL